MYNKIQYLISFNNSTFIIIQHCLMSYRFQGNILYKFIPNIIRISFDSAIVFRSTKASQFSISRWMRDYLHVSILLYIPLFFYSKLINFCTSENTNNKCYYAKSVFNWSEKMLITWSRSGLYSGCDLTFHPISRSYWRVCKDVCGLTLSLWNTKVFVQFTFGSGRLCSSFCPFVMLSLMFPRV